MREAQKHCLKTIGPIWPAMPRVYSKEDVSLMVSMLMQQMAER